MIAIQQNMLSNLNDEVIDENLPNYLFLYQQEVDGKAHLASTVAGVVQPDNHRSAACKVAVHTAKNHNALAACTMQDAAFDSYSATLPKLKPAPIKNITK